MGRDEDRDKDRDKDRDSQSPPGETREQPESNQLGRFYANNGLEMIDFVLG